MTQFHGAQESCRSGTSQLWPPRQTPMSLLQPADAERWPNWPPLPGNVRNTLRSLRYTRFFQSPWRLWTRWMSRCIYRFFEDLGRRITEVSGDTREGYLVCQRLSVTIECDFRVAQRRFGQSIANPLLFVICVVLTLSTPAVPNCCRSKGSAPYWSNPPFLISDIRALWRSVLSARVPECQKLKMAG